MWAVASQEVYHAGETVSILIFRIQFHNKKVHNTIFSSDRKKRENYRLYVAKKKFAWKYAEKFFLNKSYVLI